MDIRGVGRSGTTLIYQVMSLIDNIQLTSQAKVHSKDRCSNKIIICVRDFRDILVSRWRVEILSMQHRHDEFYNRQMTKKEIDLILTDGHMQNQMNNMNKISQTSSEGLLILHYENFYNNFNWLFDTLDSFLKITISNREEIINECNIDKNMTRITNLKSFKEVEKSYQFHGHHISPNRGKSSWIKYIPNDLHNYVTEILKNDLIKWGY